MALRLRVWPDEPGVVACQIPEVVVLDTVEQVSSPETPDVHGAYPRLSGPQIEALDAHGRRRRTQPGDVLFLTPQSEVEQAQHVEGLTVRGGSTGCGRPFARVLAGQSEAA